MSMGNISAGGDAEDGGRQWQQGQHVLRSRAGPNPVIDPRQDPPEDVPVLGFRPAGEYLPSTMELGTPNRSWGLATADGQLC